MKYAIMAACVATLVPAGASAATIFGVDERNNLVSLESSSPGTMLSSVAIIGAPSSFQALDFRPLNNVLYGLGADRVVYTIDTLTGVASSVGSALNIEGSVFGFDFNPTIDRVRIVSNTNNNYVFNPNDGSLTGAPTTTSLGYAAGDVNFGRDPGASGAAYTSSSFGAPGGSTQLYVVDTDTDMLARQNNNGGVLTTVGALGTDLGSRTSFDIAGSDAFVFNERTLYQVNLQTGALTALGDTDRALFGIAISAVPEPATWGMMMVGFGAVGGALRRRKGAIKTTVRFA